jgi:hypothetical protein
VWSGKTGSSARIMRKPESTMCATMLVSDLDTFALKYSALGFCSGSIDCDLGRA